MAIYKRIEVIPYNPDWPQMFASESLLIKQALGDDCVDIHHVGSTSVPNLAAKPIIDIIAVIKDPIQAISQLERVGFIYKGEWNIPFKYGFSKRGEVDVNLHVYEEEHPEIAFNLIFRDYLRSSPSARDEYAALKESLLRDPASFQKNESMFAGYTLGKEAFITKILHQEGFDKLRFMHCAHIREWETAKNFRQTYFFDKRAMIDPYTWTFNHSEHIHFVLYSGTHIVGYAHLQLWPEKRAAMRVIVIEDSVRGLGFGKHFLFLCEKWLRQKEYRILHIESSPEAYEFYQKSGYERMPFSDPENHPSDVLDIAMGKIL